MYERRVENVLAETPVVSGCNTIVNEILCSFEPKLKLFAILKQNLGNFYYEFSCFGDSILIHFCLFRNNLFWMVLFWVSLRCDCSIVATVSRRNYHLSIFHSHVFIAVVNAMQVSCSVCIILLLFRCECLIAQYVLPVNRLLLKTR